MCAVLDEITLFLMQYHVQNLFLRYHNYYHCHIYRAPDCNDFFNDFFSNKWFVFLFKHKTLYKRNEENK